MNTLLSLEEKRKRVMEMCPIDDVFFEVLASKADVCQEILRTIMKNPDLVVDSVQVQSPGRNLYGRSVRLDALCVLSDKSMVNIEVQRNDNEDHLKRVRYYGSIITARNSDPGKGFKDVVNLCVVYISAFDVFKEGKTIYHVRKILEETGTEVDNGFNEIYVNTEIKDGTDISDLMSCFLETKVDNPKFPVLSGRIKELKEEERKLQN